LRRIVDALRNTPATNAREIERKRGVLLPAAEYLDKALVQLDQKFIPGTDPVTAWQYCADAAELLREHKELESVIRDLNEVVTARAEYVP
jgi:hypothetical protein